MIIDLTKDNMTIEEALFIAKPHDIIKLADKVYYEKIKISIPHLTIEGTGNTTIEFDAYNSRIIPVSMGGDGIKKFGTTGSATVTVLPEAIGFKAHNVTFKNSFIRKEGIDGGQAVAFKSETSNIELINCKFISLQDTLYIDYGINNVIKDSYIEGDVDFIFGSSDCLFDNCNIVARNVTGIAYYTAPDTFIINDYGFIFNNCTFEASANVKAYLGRAWFPSGAPQPVYPRIALINCKFINDNDLTLLQMHDKDPLYQSVKINKCSMNNILIDRNDCISEELDYIKSIRDSR